MHLTILSTEFLGVPEAHTTIDGEPVSQPPVYPVWTGEVKSTDTEGHEVNVKFNVANRVAFDDGARVVETLQLLEFHVRQTLLLFESAFT